MKGREFKDMVFQLFAMIAQGFSSPKRLEIIDILFQGERDVETLSRSEYEHSEHFKPPSDIKERKIGREQKRRC